MYLYAWLHTYRDKECFNTIRQVWCSYLIQIRTRFRYYIHVFPFRTKSKINVFHPCDNTIYLAICRCDHYKDHTNYHY